MSERKDKSRHPGEIRKFDMIAIRIYIADAEQHLVNGDTAQAMAAAQVALAMMEYNHQPEFWTLLPGRIINISKEFKP